MQQECRHWCWKYRGEDVTTEASKVKSTLTNITDMEERLQNIKRDCEKCGKNEYVGSRPNGDTLENAGHVSIVLNNKTDNGTTVDYEPPVDKMANLRAGGGTKIRPLGTFIQILLNRSFQQNFEF